MGVFAAIAGANRKDFSSTDPRVVESALAYATERLRLCGLSTGSVETFRLALLEAVGNVVRHAAGKAHDFSISVASRRKNAVVEVVDHGPGFELRSPRMPHAFAEGGRGVPIMQRLLDSVEYRQSADGNRLILKLRIREEERG